MAAVALIGALAAPCLAQVSSYGDKSEGSNVNGGELPTVLHQVGITQKLNQPLPMDATFVDETGKPVKLGDYFTDKKPALLSLVYYKCQVLCSEEMDGLTSALEMVHLQPARDFNIIFISIDPSETPADAMAQKTRLMKRFDQPGTASGWHFLTGKQPEIDALAKATGFGYVRVPAPDGKGSQFAHASSLEIVTSDGKIAQYYLGVEYSPKDLLLGLVEASGNRIGSPVANILTYCYHYDPQVNRHSLIVARVVQLGGMVTVAGLGGFMFLMFRRDAALARGQDLTRERTDKG
jgi:protein SCO1/2